jgi:hypothetical protein
MQRNSSNIRDLLIRYNLTTVSKLMGVYCLDLVTPGTYLHNTMYKTDIVHALNQYVEKLNIVLKTFKKTKNIG